MSACGVLCMVVCCDDWCAVTTDLLCVSLFCVLHAVCRVPCAMCRVGICAVCVFVLCAVCGVLV